MVETRAQASDKDGDADFRKQMAEMRLALEEASIAFNEALSIQRRSMLETNELINHRIADSSDSINRRLEEICQRFSSSGNNSGSREREYGSDSHRINKDGQDLGRTGNKLNSGSDNHQGYTALTRMNKLEFPRFNGDRLKDWLFRVEQFFLMDKTPEDLKCTLAAVHFDGEAATWNHANIQSDGEVDYGWENYKSMLKDRFEESDEDPQEELKDLKEDNGIMEYHHKFEVIRARITDVPEKVLLEWYLAGLRLDTRMHIEMFRPKTIRECMILGKLYEKVPPKRSYSAATTSNSQHNLPIGNYSKEIDEEEITQTREEPVLVEDSILTKEVKESIEEEPIRIKQEDEKSFQEDKWKVSIPNLEPSLQSHNASPIVCEDPQYVVILEESFVHHQEPMAGIQDHGIKQRSTHQLLDEKLRLYKEHKKKKRWLFPKGLKFRFKKRVYLSEEWKFKSLMDQFGVLEGVIRYRWKALSSEQRDGMKSCISKVIVQLQEKWKLTFLPKSWTFKFKKRDSKDRVSFKMLSGKEENQYCTDHTKLFRQESYFAYLFGDIKSDFYAATDTERSGMSLLYLLDDLITNGGNFSKPVSLDGINDFGTDLTTPHPITAECQVIKSSWELYLTQFANEISSEPYIEVMRRVTSGMKEYQMGSMFLHHSYMYSGYRNCSYTFTCAIGNNRAVFMPHALNHFMGNDTHDLEGCRKGVERPKEHVIETDYETQLQNTHPPQIAASNVSFGIKNDESYETWNVMPQGENVGIVMTMAEGNLGEVAANDNLSPKEVRGLENSDFKVNATSRDVLRCLWQVYWLDIFSSTYGRHIKWIVFFYFGSLTRPPEITR